MLRFPPPSLHSAKTPVLISGGAPSLLFSLLQLFGQHIALLYTLSLVVGAVYSVPPLRLKQRPLPAMACIVLCRGFLLNYGVNDAALAALGRPFAWSGPVAFITGQSVEILLNYSLILPPLFLRLADCLCARPPSRSLGFVTCFAVIISAAKDLPDVEGDRKEQIQTFATWLGTGKVAMASVGLLMANYVVAMILGLTQVSHPQPSRSLSCSPLADSLSPLPWFDVCFTPARHGSPRSSGPRS